MMNRRNFLENAATLATGIALSSTCSIYAQHSSTADKPLIKKSLKYGMIQEDLSVLDKFKLLKDLGFDGVELNSPNELNIKEVLEAQEQTSLEIPGLVNSLHWKMPISDPDPEVRKQCVESMKQALRECQQYGGTTVLLVAGVVNENVSYTAAYKRSQEEIRKLIPVVEETGIKIAIENVWNNFLISPVEAARYIDELDHPMIGWYFDVGNIIRYGWPAHWIEALGERIMKIDIKEYSREKQRNEGVWKGFEVELLEGDCDWPAVNAALAKVGYQGWGSAEVPGGDRKRLAKISELMDKIYAS